jgi:hypothetical protein
LFQVYTGGETMPGGDIDLPFKLIDAIAGF